MISYKELVRLRCYALITLSTMIRFDVITIPFQQLSSFVKSQSLRIFSGVDVHVIFSCLPLRAKPIVFILALENRLLVNL